MKTVVLLIVSSLFLSNMPSNREKDSIEKVMTYKIEKKETINVENRIDHRTPIIILKRD
ncbi:MAG: hypothetical protein L6Q46_09740 [Flavobacterium sp.]|uniref:hypothetical protein n=1 Tax=Flavobacterium sp. TaxID=239 RepID=UPI0025BDAC56|nr:hypothetical protein [Flavobacterium sp.]MCK6608562.1 hypothetical protein [Flavobacterium sp.]